MAHRVSVQSGRSVAAFATVMALRLLLVVLVPAEQFALVPE